MTFKIKGVNDNQQYQTPDEYARPLVEAPPILRYPESRGYTGEGKPCARIGLPWAVVGRDFMTSTAFDWWKARVGATLAPVIVGVTLWDPKTVAWGTYQAWLDWPPKYEQGLPDVVPKLAGVRFTFSHIESTT